MAIDLSSGKAVRETSDAMKKRVPYLPATSRIENHLIYAHILAERRSEFAHARACSDSRPGLEIDMERQMAPTRRMFGIAILFAVLGSASLGYTPATAATASGALQALDTDHDGTVDLAEAKAAASKLFDKLDRDHDGTLDRRELRGRLVSKEFAAADGDRDGTLDKDEYLAFVEKSFKAADRDNDGTLDAKELSGLRGRMLLRLLR